MPNSKNSDYLITIIYIINNSVVTDSKSVLLTGTQLLASTRTRILFQGKYFMTYSAVH